MTGKDARNRNKARKQNYKQNLLPTDKRQHSNNNSDGSGSDTDNKTTSGKSGVANRPPGANNKKLRTFDEEKDMEEDFALGSDGSHNSDKFFDAENTIAVDANSGSTPAAAAGTGSTTPGSTPADSTSRVASPNQEIVHSYTASTNKENSNGPVNSQPNPPNVSQHDNSNKKNDDDDDVIMNGSNTSAALTASTACYQAACKISDLLKEKETKNQCLNRLTSYFIDRYESFVRVAFNGSIAEGIAIVSVKQFADHDDLTKSLYSDIIPKAGADAPKFFNYDAHAILASSKSRSIVIRDIPLFTTKEMIISKFKSFGIIDKIKLRTSIGASFQQADITYSDPEYVRKITNRWSTFVGGECVRIYPASLTPDEQKSRGQYAAVLRGIKSGIRAIDLENIYSQVNAQAIGLPRSPKSYLLRPWAYFFFASEEARNAAIEISCTFNERPVEWILPDVVKNLCVRCSSKDHKPSACDAFTRSRKSAPKNVQALYDKFKINQNRGRTRDSGFSNFRSNSASRSRSRSRNNSRPSNPSSSDQQSPKKVSYADSVNKTLEDSIHNPQNLRNDNNHNNNRNKINNNNDNRNSSSQSNKGKTSNRDPSVHASNMAQLNQQAFADMASAANNILSQLTFLSNKLNNWCQMMSTMDQRVARIEKLIVSQVDFNFIDNTPINTPEVSISSSNDNQVIPNHSISPSVTSPSAQLDIQAEIKSMQQQLGGEISSAISQMNSFLSNFASMTDSPANPSSSSNNNSQ